tara:strand:- start:1823 stop:2599 length:777 start_codon:yes stop_codon:yes gene_type:complete
MKFIFFLAFLTINVFGVSDVADIRNNVGWDEKYGQMLDVNSRLISQTGQETTFDSILSDDNPTVLVLAYYSCPKMCSFILDGVSEVVAASEMRPGVDYNLVTLSFNQSDTPELSQNYYNKFANNLSNEESWSFYTSDEESIQKITSSVGFKFQPDGDEFAHPAGIIILTSERVVSRYLSGVIYDPRDFKLALLEASEGTTGKVSLTDKVLLYCFDFDPVGKRYALKALNVMKLGGAITLIAIIIMMGILWLKKSKGDT